MATVLANPTGGHSIYSSGERIISLIYKWQSAGQRVFRTRCVGRYMRPQSSSPQPSPNHKEVARQFLCDTQTHMPRVRLSMRCSCGFATHLQFAIFQRRRRVRSIVWACRFCVYVFAFIYTLDTMMSGPITYTPTTATFECVSLVCAYGCLVRAYQSIGGTHTYWFYVGSYIELKTIVWV